jgi:hypothetical protein
MYAAAWREAKGQDRLPRMQTRLGCGTAVCQALGLVLAVVPYAR